MRTIDKVTINKGAVFDYEEIVCKIPFDYTEYKKQVEKLLFEADTTKEDLRLIFRDEKANKDLMLFLKKGYRFGIMQMWILQGICEECDYDIRFEENGKIKEWLEVEIE